MKLLSKVFRTQGRIEKKGFSIIELIVVIGIFSIILSVALFNQGKLNNNILLTNLAYEIALLVRETQAYGIGVRAQNTEGGFQGGYGISFDPRSPNRIFQFNDINNNKILDQGELASEYIIQNQRGNTIVAQCIGEASGPCMDNNKLINVVFQRPNPEAFFTRADVNGGTAGPFAESAGPAYIVVETPMGENCRVVVIEQTGQIRVETNENGNCQ